MSLPTCPNCRADVPDREPPVAFCPRCGTALADAGPIEADPASGPDVGSGSDEPRPAEDAGPLAGWDRGRQPAQPTEALPDGVVVALGAVVGLVAGTVVAPGGRRGRVGLVGMLLGAAVPAAFRRIWELDPPDTRWVDHLQR